jgi:hypothetical protein
MSMVQPKAPNAVLFLQEALSERMGRPASVRVVKGSPSHWYVFDPSFSVLQRGAGSNPRGYRSGIFVDDHDISFCNVHSRTPAMLLRQNLLKRPEALLLAAERSRHLRESHHLHFASRAKSRNAVRKSWSDTVRVIESSSWSEFKGSIAADPYSLIRDMFPMLPSAGRVGTGAAVRGSDFCLLLADRRMIDSADSNETYADRAGDIVDAAWNLFACLYPWDAPKARVMQLCGAQCSRSLGYLNANIIRLTTRIGRIATAHRCRQPILFLMLKEEVIVIGMGSGFVLSITA